jgi:IclR family transcriptional regulator, acetate operon repressor
MATRRASSASASRPHSAEANRGAARVLDVLELFFESEEPYSLTDVSDQLRLPKSTTHSILHTLWRRGYVSCDAASKTYSLALQVVARANAAPIVRLLQPRARLHLDRLATQLEETALLLTVQGGYAVAIDMVESPRSLRYVAKLGRPWPLYATGAGKLYLAQYSDEEVRALLADGLRPLTARTHVDAEPLLHEIADARRQGWSWQRGEIIDDVHGFAAPVVDSAGRFVASLVVTGPADRMAAAETQIIERLVEEAVGLSEYVQRRSPTALAVGSRP